MPPPTAHQKAGETDIFKLDGTDICTLALQSRVNNQALRTIDDYCDLARHYLKRMHDENVVHVEVAVSPQSFRRRGLEVKPCIEALASAFREALDNFGMTGGIIAGCRRDLSWTPKARQSEPLVKV
jgi:hypothetical protein